MTVELLKLPPTVSAPEPSESELPLDDSEMLSSPFPPLTLSPPVVDKLSAIHDLVHGNKLPDKVLVPDQSAA